MKNNGWILLLIFATGLFILLLPDHADPVFRLNRSHGPSFLDLIGLLLMSISWLVSTIIVVKYSKVIVQKIGKNISTTLLFFYFPSLAGIAFSLRLSKESLLWISIATHL